MDLDSSSWSSWSLVGVPIDRRKLIVRSESAPFIDLSLIISIRFLLDESVGVKL